MVDDGRKRHVVGIHVDTPPHAVAQAVGLLEDFLEHEERVASFLQLAEVDVHRLHGGMHPGIVHVHHLQLMSRTDDGDVPVFQIYHLVRIFHDRRGIRSQVKVIVMPDTDHQRTTLARRDNLFGMPLVENGYGVCADNLMQGHLHGPQQRQVIVHLNIFDKLHQHLRIRLAAESHPALDQAFLDGGIVLDDSVMYQRQIARSRIVGMGILRTRLSVRGPPRMGDAHMAADIFVLHRPLQVADLSLSLINIQLARIADQSHTSTVIATIFQTFKPFYQDGISFPLTDITNDSTHIPFNL